MMNSDWLIKLIKKTVMQVLVELGLLQPQYKIGTIDPAYTSGRPKVLFDGEDTLSAKQYPRFSSYTPVAGDRVVLAKMPGGYVIQDKII